LQLVVDRLLLLDDRLQVFAGGDQLLATLRAEAVERPELEKDLLYRAADLNGTLVRPADTWSLYEEVGNRFGRDDDLLGRMAAWCKQREKREDARRLYGEFKNRAAGLGNIAAMLLEEGKVAEAIEVFRKLIEIDGEHADAHLWSIAECHEKLAEWKKAIGTYQQVDRFPDNQFRMAACHRKLGELQEAIVLYNQIKIVDSAAPEASLQIGFTYEEAKEKVKAIRTFQLTCKRYPKSGEAGRAHAHLQNEYNINVTLGGSEEE
jgi:tetratricopeptide (TPR) repeat protein